MVVQGQEVPRSLQLAFFLEGLGSQVGSGNGNTVFRVTKRSQRMGRDKRNHAGKMSYINY
jgi:hypothetical protein